MYGPYGNASILALHQQHRYHLSDQPPTHTCAQTLSIRRPADARRTSLSHIVLLFRESFFHHARCSITQHRLSPEWAAASEVIDTTTIIIRQVVRVFLYASTSGERRSPSTVTPWLWKDKKKTQNTAGFFLLTRFARSGNTASLKKKGGKKKDVHKLELQNTV